MSENNIEESTPQINNDTIENVEEQATTSHNTENIPPEGQGGEHNNEESNDVEDKVDKSKRSAKILLIIVNVCTLICSIILFVVGVVMTVKHAKVHEEWHVAYGFWNASIICIVISLILAAIASIGLVGTLREDRCMLITFSSLLGLLICIEIALSIALLALVRGESLGSVVEGKMRSSMKHFEVEGYEGVSTVWDIVQTELECCGVKNATDWYRTYIKNRNKSKKILPDSCCSTRPLHNNLGSYACTYQDENHPPNSAECLTALEKSIIRNEGVIAGIIVIVALGQVGLIIASVHLMKNTKKATSCPPFY